MAEKEPKVPGEPEGRKAGSELIDLEYIVRFDDGLRPTLLVYGIDSQTGDMYGADAYIGIQVGVGFRPAERDGRFFVQERSFIGIPRLVQRFDGVPEEEFIDGYEESMQKQGQEEKYNVVRIKSREHITPAIDRHAQLYAEQFKPLELEISGLFDAFIKQHPVYWPAKADEPQKESQEEKK